MIHKKQNTETFKFVPQNYNILIIEDAKLINTVLQQKFSAFGYNCFCCFNIIDGKEALKNNDIDYIVLDMYLPDGSGQEIIYEVKDSSTKIFVLSKETDINFHNKTYDDGIIEFFTKDHNFLYKIDNIIKKIEILENNRLKTILVVTEAKAMQVKLGTLLIEQHYNIEYASNTSEVMEIVLNKNIDLLLLDVELDVLHGIEFLKEHNSQIIVERNIPVLILSTHVARAIIRDGLNAGAVDVLKKPFIPEEIILKVNLWILHRQQENDINESTKLLVEYKETVDRSSIVSKTDSRGIITYVNDQFCHITEYSKDEIIGLSHNILRHEDSSIDLFKDLWKIIKDKKEPWEGIIKNKTKTGKSYWINIIINPILDIDNNVLEYIAISKDISNDVKVKEYFQNQIDKSTKTLGQAINLSSEYKRAMNESSIVSRTNLKGEIIFVNDEFCRISEYSEKELLGHNHNIIRHPDSKRELFKDMWMTIKSGKTWKGIIQNKTKTGKLYWIDSTIVPIKDKEEKIIEYMGIRKEVTKLFELHEEIGSTQKEIIYRMGEIGETRSKETGNHVKRVAEYSKILAKFYGLSDEEVDILFTASPMHDIGKVGISDAILTKPGKLTTEEFEIMKTHAEIGANILKGSKREVLKGAAIVAKEHHEKWDGTGYPSGLKGEQIHIYGRITAIADVLDALGSERCYKKAWEDEEIFNFLKKEKGISFDPILINIFFRHIDEFLEIRNKYRDKIVDTNV